MANDGKHPVPSWIRRGKLRWVWGLWEPLMLYRRQASIAPYSPGNALWAEDWYLRMHSREMVEKLADLGVNVISTHYYKGFGVDAEAEEMERATRFTELCHTFGMKVLGYHQWATICYETFLDEVPDARDWIQRDAEGKLLLYGTGCYWRWLGCQQHDAYFEYLKNVVRRCLTEARMDGIEWDGNVYRCHCDLCQQRFREYLQEKYDGVDVLPLFGLPHFRNVRIPSAENRRDPLYQEALQFRRDFLDRRLSEFNDLIKSIDPEAAQVTYALDPAPKEPLSAVDLIVDENHDHSFVQDGVLTTKFRGLKHGFAYDRVVLSTGWLRAPSTRGGDQRDHFDDEADLAAFGYPAGRTRRPETPAEVTRDLAEVAMYGGHMITPTWATRPIGGDRAAFEEPVLYDTLRHTMHFFRRHEDLYDATQSLANVGIVRSRSSITHDYFNSYPCVFGMEQVCLQHQIPFDMVFSYMMRDLSKWDALVLAEQTCLSDDEIARLKAFVGGGGGLVITGRTGIHDERFRLRRSHPLEELFDHPRVTYLPDSPERRSRPERDHPPAYHDMRLPERSEEIAAAIEQAAGGHLPYRLEAGRLVGTDAYRIRSGQRVVHLLNYDNDQPVGPLALHLSEALAVPQARLISLGASPEEATIRPEGDDGRCFIVDRLETYSMLVLSPASGA